MNGTEKIALVKSISAQLELSGHVRMYASGVGEYGVGNSVRTEATLGFKMY